MSEETRDFLILILNKEIEEEFRTCDNKEWIRDCIKAKKELLMGKGRKVSFIDRLVYSEMLKEDIEKYLKG